MSDVSSLRKKINAISQEMDKADPQFKAQMEGFVEVRDVNLPSSFSWQDCLISVD